MFSQQRTGVQPNRNQRAGGRIRLACDACRQSKTKCVGGHPCVTCRWSQVECHYSPGGRLGRPKGSKNKKTQQCYQENPSSGNPANLQMQKTPGNTDTDTNPNTNPNNNNKNSSSGSNSSNNVSGFQPANLSHLLYHLNSMHFDFDMNYGMDPITAAADAARGSGTESSIGGDENDNGEEDDVDDFMLDPALDMTMEGENPTSADLGSAENFASHGSMFASIPSVGSPLDLSQMVAPSASVPAAPSGAIGTDRGCSCLQQLVWLLYQHDKLHHVPSQRGYQPGAPRGPIGPSMDSVLASVQAAEEPWQRVMGCGIHQAGKDLQEANLMVAMSIRTLLSLVSKLLVTFNQTSSSTPPTPELSSSPSDVVVSVGGFKLTGERKVQVLGLTIRQALQPITTAMRHLWERVGQPELPNHDSFGSSEVGGGTTSVAINYGISDGNSTSQRSPLMLLQQNNKTSRSPSDLFSAELKITQSLLDTLEFLMTKAMEQDHQTGP